MMNEPTNINHKDEDCQEERLHYECEQALLRIHFEKPSAEEEWVKFREGLAVKSRKRILWRVGGWILGGIAAAVAIWVVVLLPWHRTEEKEEEVLVLFTATESGYPVIMEKQSDKSFAASTVIVADNKEEKVIEGVVYSDKKVDYTRHSGKSPRKSVVSIPCGQVYKLILNDSTEVWLNAGSSLTFPTRFSGKQRLVKLEGEAYFKVARNENMPFVIETEKLTARVLGTEFNMKVYKDSESHVTLVKGAVKVDMPELDKEVVLMPGEDMAYVDSNFCVKKVDTDYYTQWRFGYFYFDDMYLVDILSDLGRWYNMTVEMEPDSLLMNQRLHFVVERSENCEQLVANLNAFEYLSVVSEDGKWIVRRKK